MNEDFRLNIIALGQTGVGKSALLNYLFKADFKTGAGTPQTPKEVDKPELKEHFVEANNHKFHIFDSWGIEADKVPEWKEMLETLKEQHDGTKKPEDWFHVVVYCIDASSARIQDIDIEIVSDFINLGYNVVAAFTKIESISEEDEEDMKTALKTGIHKKIANESFPISIVPVTSVEKKTRMGIIKPQGREELINAIISSWVETVKRRISVAVKERLFSELNSFKIDLEKFIDSYNISGRREGNDELTRVLEEKNSEKMQILVSETLTKETNELLKSCYDIGCNLQTSFGEAEVIELKVSFDDFNKKNNGNLVGWYMAYGLTLGVLPLFNELLPALKEKQRTEFKTVLLPAVINSNKQYLETEIIPQLQKKIEEILNNI